MSHEASPAERPATFREVFAHGEYRAVFVACALSWVGDYMAKAAVTLLVYNQTRSVALSAASFAVSYLPWVLGGPLLAAIAERHPYRQVMVTCDLVRMVLIALVALPGLPVALRLFLLFLTMLANPPTQAARSALMPLILTRDRLVVGLTLLATTAQAAQVGGYLAGAALAAIDPAAALLLDAATFAVSAVVLRFGVRARPPAITSAQRSHLLRETGEGFRVVFGDPVLRAIAVVVFGVTLFAIVPEALAAAWAARTNPSEDTRGLSQGLIMAASPVGFILGGLLIGRLVRPDLRRALVRPFAVLAPLALVPALLGPSAPVVAAMGVVSGFAVAGLMPTANGLFVLALRPGYRARAFGVMQAGMQLMQGGAVLVTGLLAERFDLPTVVGLWSLAGVVLMVTLAHRWPGPQRFDAAIAAAAADNDAADPNARPALDVPPGPEPAERAPGPEPAERAPGPEPAERAPGPETPQVASGRDTPQVALGRDTPQVALGRDTPQVAPGPRKVGTGIRRAEQGADPPAAATRRVGN